MSNNMADRPSTVQMAVTSENQDFKGPMTREELDNRANSNSPKTVVDGIPKKKGTFKITSVKLNDTGDADSMDDLDESHTEMTEDYSSELLDTSRATDYEQETPSVTEDIPLNSQVRVSDVKERSDIHSRFRVVKIETKEPFRRGRWFCHDFLDPQPSSVNIDKSDTKVNQEDANSGSSSAGSSIHYIHGVDDPAKNPLLAGATGTIHSQIPEGQVAGVQDSFQPIHPSPNTAVNQPAVSNNQVTSLAFTNDALQGVSNMCQSINKSHSHQSISSVTTTDMINVSSGQAMQGELQSIHHSKPVISGVTPIDSSNTGMYLDSSNTGMYLPHYTSGPGPVQGTTMSIPTAYQHTHTQSTPIVSSDNISVAANQQGQSSTFQTYVHLGGHQIPNTEVTQSGLSETRPSGEANLTGIGLQLGLDGMKSNDLPTVLSNIESGATDNMQGELDKDLTVIQDTGALSPALAAAVSDLQSPTEEDKSGSSTVAIDNKIEQAMDLVKSHLMFAVREEVEVLKVQIAELIERNNQLEYENGILRAAASPETLAKLAQPRQPPPSSSS